MRLVLQTLVVLVAFAANSILTRVGIASGGVSAEMFAVIRVLSGALLLAMLVIWQRGKLWGSPSLWGVLSLSAYMIGFSQAYITLDAGLGALILFGGVQLTMFAGALGRGETIPLRRWLGMGLALVGLAWVTGATAVSGALQLGILWMTIAAVGWGIYSLVGQRVSDPLLATAQNFVWTLPLMLLLLLPGGEIGPVLPFGLSMAVMSGAVTSGLGYALWYHVLPQLKASVAAVAQLCVPVIAIVAGNLLLGEVVTLAIVLGSALVLGGIALAISARSSRADRT